MREQRKSFRERGYDSRWDKLKALKKRSAPLCEECLKKGRVTPAYMIHHITPINEGGAMYDFDNLESVCRDCHAVLHGADPGKMVKGCGADGWPTSADHPWNKGK